MDDSIRKKVDESWKDQIEKDKKVSEEKNETYHQPTFIIFLSSLAMQAMIALGKLENPLTGKTETNLEQARFLIDTLEIINEKTKNNLTEQESKFFEDSLYNLRMIYIEQKGKI